MPITSLSFPKELLDEMDAVQKSSGFTGRSELVRAAIRMMLEDNRRKESLSGEINGLIVVTHDEDEEEPVTKLKHGFEDIIKTHLHSKTTSSICVELFLVHGDAKKIVAMSMAFEAEDRMKSTKFLRV